MREIMAIVLRQQPDLGLQRQLGYPHHVWRLDRGHRRNLQLRDAHGDRERGRHAGRRHARLV